MIRYRKDTDNIVTLIFDMEDRRDNVINHKIVEALIPIVEHLQQEKLRRSLRGVIITSAKQTFLEGGDLEYLYQAEDAEEIYKFSESIQKVFRSLEVPGVPVVAAINGTALGAGFELALACHHRIALDKPKLKVGLREIKLGMIPAGGGIIRLMWLLGIEKAYKILTEGHRHSPQEALEVGLIDEIVSTEKEMMDKAKEWLLEHREGRRPWDITEEKIPYGTASKRDVALMIRKKAAELSKITHNNYPAYQAILNVLAEGSKVDFDTALRIERRYYTNLVRGKVAKNMIKTFWFDYNAIKNGQNRPRGFGKFRPKKIGIIGAGLMGSGIAMSCLNNGMEVILKDVSKLIAERGKGFVKGKLRERVDRHEITLTEKREMLKRIQTTENAQDFETCDIVIEAVFENRMVKQKVTREAEEFMDEYSFIASNTVSIPITRLAEAHLRPENYIGLHFFHPAESVPLVEIINGKQTSEETIARAFDFVRAIRKTPILVKDRWGFYAARVQNTYVLEGITMLQEGYTPALIENLGRHIGMPKGALEIADDLTLPLILKYERQAAEHYGKSYLQHPAVKVLDKMLDELGRTGRTRDGGFYEQVDEQKQLWEDLTKHFPITQTDYDIENIKERLLFAQVIEAGWCLQEKIIKTDAEANLGSVFGWGFPAFHGGVIQFIHSYGKDHFIAKCAELEAAHGPRFQVPKYLREKI
ncbi:MAG: 3-hydroxyacyl-CoA dehydrogenase NAD-binding domain-containing protein [Saprospiraceae bacterium]